MSGPGWPAIAARAALPLLVGLSLLGGIAGGLSRAGVAVADAAGEPWLGRAALDHAALMICGFLGTVIGVERAVAVGLRPAFAAPLASGLGGLALLLGLHAVGASLLGAAAIVFIGVNGVVARRQSAAHVHVLVAGALAWGIGVLMFALGWPPGAVLPWWFGFLLLTIAAERLEMSRLAPPRPYARALLYAVLALQLWAAALSAAYARSGGVLFGCSLTLLALWLAVFDIARRTIAAKGLSRYMALCLLSGYGWLGLGGVAWAATALGWPARDAALHSLGLGFIFSMMMGHAPVILPAVARLKLKFSGLFYLPLAALHASLVVRLGFGLFDPSSRTQGAVLNAVAIALFASTLAVAALEARR